MHYAPLIYTSDYIRKTLDAFCARIKKSNMLPLNVMSHLIALNINVRPIFDGCVPGTIVKIVGAHQVSMVVALWTRNQMNMSSPLFLVGHVRHLCVPLFSPFILCILNVDTHIRLQN